ncbi:MAG: phytoene/squalene synthase family protein [Pseudoxanthomonas sp.]
MTDTTALDSFLGKWRSRWPEWQVAEVFVPAAQRETAVAWFALLQEFEDAMNVAGDLLPADAKLAWWGEELRDWSRRRSRHPLGRVLEPQAGPEFFDLAESLPALQRLRERPAGPQAAFDTVRPLALAIANAEATLSGLPTDEAQIRSFAAQMLASRLWAAGAAAVPQGLDEAQWARALLQHWPARVKGGRARRLWSALARSRLQRHEGVGPDPSARKRGDAKTPSHPVSSTGQALRVLWLAWRAARA